MEENAVIKALAALAKQNCLQVFRCLVATGPQGATPGQLGEQLGVPNATLSFHLKELLNAGLISQERQGRHLVYRVALAQMNGVLAYLTENCCQGVEACGDAAACCTPTAALGCCPANNTATAGVGPTTPFCC